MLKKIKISNFHSIGNEVEVSFEADTPIYIMLGANGSGKTTLLKALCFLFWFMSKSTQDEDDMSPMLPHAALDTLVTCFEIEYREKGIDYKYMVKFDKQILFAEGLWSRASQGKYKRIFTISHEKDTISTDKLSSDLKKILNKNDFKRYAGLNNISFFAFLKSTGYLQLLNIGFDTISKVHSNVRYLGRDSQMGGANLYLGLHEILEGQKDLQDFLITFLQELDYSIARFEFRDETISQNNAPPKKMITTGIKYKWGEKEMSMPLLFESEGTCAIIPILLGMHMLKEKGGLFIWDELESSIHPLAAKKIISRLEHYAQTEGRQVLFTTHMNELMNQFDKKNILLVEKTEDLQTDVYTLNDVQGVRKDENFADKYMGGLYGGTPNIRGVI